MEYLPKRKQIRLKDYDYSANGYYFITVCTKDRKNLFLSTNISRVGADIIRPELSVYGNVADKGINNISLHYPQMVVDEYVIMPDHIHLILKILNHDKNGQIISAPTCKTISTAIGQMKRWVSKEIGFPVWQKSFYEHVIRDEQDYLARVEYMRNNPLKHLLNP